MEYTSRTVGEIAAEVPHSTKIFAKHGIDFCCGGKKPLAEACSAAGVAMSEVVEQIEKVATNGETPVTRIDLRAVRIEEAR